MRLLILKSEMAIANVDIVVLFVMFLFYDFFSFELTMHKVAPPSPKIKLKGMKLHKKQTNNNSSSSR